MNLNLKKARGNYIEIFVDNIYLGATHKLKKQHGHSGWFNGSDNRGNGYVSKEIAIIGLIRQSNPSLAGEVYTKFKELFTNVDDPDNIYILMDVCKEFPYFANREDLESWTPDIDKTAGVSMDSYAEKYIEIIKSAPKRLEEVVSLIYNDGFFDAIQDNDAAIEGLSPNETTDAEFLRRWAISLTGYLRANNIKALSQCIDKIYEHGFEDGSEYGVDSSEDYED